MLHVAWELHVTLRYNNNNYSALTTFFLLPFFLLFTSTAYCSCFFKGANHSLVFANRRHSMHISCFCNAILTWVYLIPWTELTIKIGSLQGQCKLLIITPLVSLGEFLLNTRMLKYIKFSAIYLWCTLFESKYIFNNLTVSFNLLGWTGGYDSGLRFTESFSPLWVLADEESIRIW